MTKTHQFLLRFLPRWLAHSVLFLWYTGLIIMIIAYANITPVSFIYWGH